MLGIFFSFPGTNLASERFGFREELLESGTDQFVLNQKDAVHSVMIY